MAADKHEQFAARCRSMELACSDAVTWLESNRSLVSNRYEGMRRSLKINTVEARKLASAADRPMTVGIFGPSQAGKSFLMGGMLRSSGGGNDSANTAVGVEPINVVFGQAEAQESKDFLGEINPTGGRETTGVVTRFSSKSKSSPPGFPVILRTLREIDIVKILSNSYVFDLPEDVVNLKEDELITLFADAEFVSAKTPVDNLQAEDVYELEQYFTASLSRHALMREFSEFYWLKAEQLLPCLKPVDRLRVLSVLWGGRVEFDQLYLELKTALDQIGHTEFMYTSMDAITNRQAGETILHVKTLVDGISDNEKGMQSVTVATDSGRQVPLRKPVITALCAELYLTLEETPREFLEHTDFLDFPGAKERLGSGFEKLAEKTELSDPLGECFLRGKVATLFENYVTDLELNSLIFCHVPEDLKVRELTDLVEHWVNRTHGSTPEARTGRPASLFFCLTKSDMFLQESVGQSDLVETLSNKMDVIERFTYLLRNWESGRPFSNSFLIRNPSGFKNEGYYHYDESLSTKDYFHEQAFVDGKSRKLQEYAEAFAKTEAAEFFSEPEKKWHEMLSINDGGISHLLGELEPVANPDLRFDQLLPRAEQLRESTHIMLSQYVVTDDVEQRVRDRTARIESVLRPLAKGGSGIPTFIGNFYISDEFVRQLYVDYVRNQFRADSADIGGDVFDLDEILGFETSSSKPKGSTGGNGSFGGFVVSHWIEHLERRLSGEVFMAENQRMDSDDLLAMVREYGSAAERLKLANGIDIAVSVSEGNTVDVDDLNERIAISVSMIVNDLVNFCGLKEFTPLESLTHDGFPSLPEKVEDAKKDRQAFIRGWMAGVYGMTQSNAKFSSGREVDVEQNRMLANIISMLDWDVDLNNRGSANDD